LSEDEDFSGFLPFLFESDLEEFDEGDELLL